jgi:hypothetical protein
VNDVEKLIAIEEIKKLRARYFRGADFKDWTLMESVFAPDVVFDIRGATTDPYSGTNAVASVSESVLTGSKTVVEAIRQGITGVSTVHHGHMPEIEILSADDAKGFWAMEDVLRWPPGSPVLSMHGYGHYHETYHRYQGEWKIQTLRITRLRVDMVLASETGESKESSLR